jgi:hypothetical protein
VEYTLKKDLVILKVKRGYEQRRFDPVIFSCRA